MLQLERKLELTYSTDVFPQTRNSKFGIVFLNLSVDSRPTHCQLHLPGLDLLLVIAIEVNFCICIYRNTK